MLFRTCNPLAPVFSNKRASILLFSVISILLCGTITFAQDRDNSDGGLVVIIFSTEKDPPRTAAVQKSAWNSFVVKLKKGISAPMAAINEVAVDDAADKARAHEIARSEKNRYSVWLRFSMTRDQLLGQKGEVIDVGRLIAKYVVFAPSAVKVIAEGEIEQDKVRESEFESYVDSDALRQSGGKQVTTRPPNHRDDMMAGKNSITMDQNAVKKVGEQVAEKVLAAIKNFEKAPK